MREVGESAGEKSRKAYDNQVDGDQIIQDARQDQNEYAENQCDQRLYRYDINMHGIVPSNVPVKRATPGNRRIK